MYLSAPWAQMAADKVLAVLRIEDSQFLDGNLEYVGDLLEMDPSPYVYGVGKDGLAGQGRRDIVLLVVVHHVSAG